MTVDAAQFPSETARAFARKVLPELLPGLAMLAAGDVAPAKDPETLARIRGVGLGTLSEAANGSLQHEAVDIQDHSLPRPGSDNPLIVRTYRPRGVVEGPLPTLLYIHGGGMIRGSVLREQAGSIRLAQTCPALVASVEYRLAPEHPYPAASEDCYQALTWLHDNAASLGGDPARLAVSGGSAGALLAAAVALMARDRSGPPIIYQMLAAPMLDDRTVWRDSNEFSGIPGWNAEMNAFAWNCLLPGHSKTMAVSPYAAPARADDLKGLPPAFIVIGQLEIFRDEAIDYASRLMKAGVPVELHVYPGAYHGWEPLNPSAELSRRSAALREAALRAALAPK